MIKLSGVLTIRNISGRNGPFSVGRLATDIGEFAIKDTLLDQYDEGRYEGDFGVTRIFPTSYVAGGRMVVEVRATLATMALAGIEALSDDRAQDITEPDPLETDSTPAAELTPTPETSPAESSAVSTESSGPFIGVDEDEILFGTLWPLGSNVKLDTTVERALFRRQKDRLKALGYRFQPVGQVWVSQE